MPYNTTLAKPNSVLKLQSITYIFQDIICIHSMSKGRAYTWAISFELFATFHSSKFTWNSPAYFSATPINRVPYALHKVNLTIKHILKVFQKRDTKEYSGLDLFTTIVMKNYVPELVTILTRLICKFSYRNQGKFNKAIKF